MESKDKKPQKPTESEDDLLNFDLDDLTLNDVDEQQGEPEEEIIELMELVEKGGAAAGKADEEIAGLLESDEGIEEETALDSADDELPDLEEILKGEEEKKPEAEAVQGDITLEFDLGAEKVTGAEEEVVGEEITASDLEEILKEEEKIDTGEIALEDLVTAGPEEMAIAEEISETDLEDMLKEPPAEEVDLDFEISADTGELLKGLVEEALQKEPEPVLPLEAAISHKAPGEAIAPPSQPVVGISEEKIEAIVTKVLQDVVERVVRETVASVSERVIRETVASVSERVIRETVTGVAEKVITEAIDALKQGLESPKD